MDGGNLLLEGRVDKTMALEGVQALKLRGDDEGCESRAAAAYILLVFGNWVVVMAVPDGGWTGRWVIR